jgi:plasmid stabilization system protein ParE
MLGLMRSILGSTIRMIASRFPYAIYYTVENETVCVHAVADTRRDPALIQLKFDMS